MLAHCEGLVSGHSNVSEHAQVIKDEPFEVNYQIRRPRVDLLGSSKPAIRITNFLREISVSRVPGRDFKVIDRSGLQPLLGQWNFLGCPGDYREPSVKNSLSPLRLQGLHYLVEDLGPGVDNPSQRSQQPFSTLRGKPEWRPDLRSAPRLNPEKLVLINADS